MYLRRRTLEFSGGPLPTIDTHRTAVAVRCNDQFGFILNGGTKCLH